MATITANQLAVGFFNMAAGGYTAEATLNLAANEGAAANSYINLPSSGLNPLFNGTQLYSDQRFASEIVGRLMSGASPALADSLSQYVVSFILANPQLGRGQVAVELIKAVLNINPGDAVLSAAAAPFKAKVALADASTSMSKDMSVLAGIANPGTLLGQTFNFGVGQDSLTGTGSDDTFNANIINNSNTFQSGDSVTGGAGNDRMVLKVGNSAAFAISMDSVGVEQVAVRAQATNVDSTDNNQATKAVTIDAQDMAGVTQWETNNSRADVIIEDVRISGGAATKTVTIAMVETDPGNVDYGVYFNQLSLRNTSSGTASINIFLLDAAAAAAPATAATPLLNQNFNAYTFYANGVKVVLGGAGTAAGAAIDAATTYPALQAAFQLALVTANVGGVVKNLSAEVAVTLSGIVNLTTEAAKDPISAVVAANFLNLNGQILTLTTTNATAISATAPGQDPGGWTAAGPAPITGAIVQTFNAGSTSSSELVTSKIILDDVGMGSTGGDLVVGGMSVGETSTSRGVERFEIEVRDNSKLQTINGTNNALREVVLTNGITSSAPSASSNTAYTTTVENAGNLTVNGNVNITSTGTGTPVGTLSDTILKGVNNANGINGYQANHHGAFGFTDVRLLDASAMTGQLAFTAQVTTDSIAKYVNRVDTQANPAGDVAGPGNINFSATPNNGANFIYTGGANNDTMAVTIDGNAAGSRSSIVSGQSDLTFVVDGGAGNDAITVNLIGGSNVGGLQNWANNQDLNNNITINGGAGNDTIRTPGAGDIVILAGDGNDVVYTDNTGLQTALANLQGAVGINAATTTSRGVWVLNTSTQAAGASIVLSDLRSDANTSTNFFKGTVSVTFKGIETQKITLSNSTTYKSTDLEINQAIKQAINTDATLNKLIVAQDGPGNTLVITSLIDGVMSDANLAVNFAVAPGTTVYSAAELAGMSAAYNTPNLTNAQALAAQVSPGVASTSYVDILATDSAGLALTGAASTSASDNFITPGAGNDIIVLGTTVGASLAQSSNEVITFTPGFGDDVIVNFAVAGNGIDHMNFAAFQTQATPATATTAAVLAAAVTLNAGAITNTDNQFSVVALNALTNGTLALATTTIKAAVDAAVQATATKQIYLVVDAATDIGTLYSVVNGTAIGDAVVQREGSIDLADTTWASVTALNIVGVGAQTEGASTAGAAVVLPGFNTIAVTAAPVAATAAADNFTFDAAPAIADVAGTNFQTTVNGFTAAGVAADKFTIDLAVANAAITTLAQLNGQQGVTVQVDPFTNSTLINFGPDANGGQLVTITLAGIVDPATVAVSVI